MILQTMHEFTATNCVYLLQEYARNITFFGMTIVTALGIHVQSFYSYIWRMAD
jgi:hypothetical protein